MSITTTMQMLLKLPSTRNLISLYSEQFNYGHREVLLEYCGLDQSALFPAVLSHYGGGPPHLRVWAKHRGPLYRTSLQLVWNRDEVDFAASKGLRYFQDIGAPWLYLCKMRGVPLISDIAPDNSRPSHIANRAEELVARNSRILFLPRHSAETLVDRDPNGARSLSRILDPARTSVCLHFADFLCNFTRGSYEALGYRVLCAGIGYTSVPYARVSDRHRFLPNFLRMVQDHDVVLADSYTTGLLYSASIGKPTRVVNIEEEGDRIWASPNDATLSERSRQELAYHPWLTGQEAYGEDAFDRIIDALGVRSMKTPSTLLSIIRPLVGVVPEMDQCCDLLVERNPPLVGFPIPGVAGQLSEPTGGSTMNGEATA